MIAKLDPHGKNVSSAVNYGRCLCTGVYESRIVEVRIGPQERKVVWDSVPQGACPRCGSRVYKLRILERLEHLMSSSR